MSETRPADPARRPRVAVVLGSGGVKCMAGLVLLRTVAAAGIPVDLIVGCSGGGLAGALHALGYDPDGATRLLHDVSSPEVFSSIDYRMLLKLAGLPGLRFDAESGFLRPGPYREALRKAFGGHRLESLDPPLLLQTTDVRTGEGVLVDRGPVWEALYASSALIPFFPPAAIGDRLLADGAFTSGLPILQAVRAGADVIVAVSFSQAGEGEPRSFLTWYHHFFNRAAVLAERMETGHAVKLHHHEIVMINMHFPRPIELWHLHELPFVYELGHEVAQARLEEIEGALSSFSGG